MRSSHVAAQAATEYGAAMSGSSAPPSSSGPRLLDQLPVDALADPIVIAVGAAGVLIIIGLLKTRRYRS